MQEDLDFFIGDEAEEQRRFREQWVVESPIEHGQIKNWDYIERFWQVCNNDCDAPRLPHLIPIGHLTTRSCRRCLQHCVFKYLKVEPEEHTFMLTEPPMNAPENREFSAEIMFETFNVKGCHIAVQVQTTICLCPCRLCIRPCALVVRVRVLGLVMERVAAD